MRKLKYIYLFAGLLLLATSCTMHRRDMVGAPVNVQMNITMADLEYVGDITGTATQSYVLGIPYGGKKKYYSAGVRGGVGNPINPSPGILFALDTDRGMNAALYDASMQRPDADFIIPFNMETTVKAEFLGSIRTYTVHAKAFKIRSK